MKATKKPAGTTPTGPGANGATKSTTKILMPAQNRRANAIKPTAGLVLADDYKAWRQLERIAADPQAVLIAAKEMNTTVVVLEAHRRALQAQADAEGWVVPHPLSPTELQRWRNFFGDLWPTNTRQLLDVELNTHPARRFLELLGKDPRTTWFRTLKPRPGNECSLSNVNRRGADLHGFDATALQRDNTTGSAIYFVTGDADQASGKNKETGKPTGCVEDPDVTACRAVFVEWDGPPIEWQRTAWRELGLPEPSLMVETGGKSIHCYWLLLEPMAPGPWRKLQTRLIAHAGGDKQCKNPSRLMRLPGFRYVDKTTGEVTDRVAELIHQADTRYSAAEIEACIPVPERPAEVAAQALEKSMDLPPRSKAQLLEALKVVPVFHHNEGRRDELLGLAMRLRVEWGAKEAQEWLERHSPNVTDMASYFSGRDPDQIKDGGIWPFLRDHYGVDLTRHDLKRSAPANNKSEPVTFEKRWEQLELHAAEMACTTWPVMKTVASLAVKASELEIPRLGQRQLEQLLEQAQRRVRAKTEPVQGGGTFVITATPWAVDEVFRQGLNLLVGQSGAGKSRLAAACMAAWLRGDQNWLQRPLRGIEVNQRHALIIGTDQPLTDWHLTLGPVGLTTKVTNTEVRVHERLTLYGLESGLQLDADGLNTIRRWVDAHPGGMVLIDSLSACLPPGADEDKSSAARPVHQLQEVLGDAWAILTHHTRKSAGKEGNIGVGAGRGSGAIDAAVSRVIGLGLIHKMENGQMVPQESDPRRELLSTKRGGKTVHLIVSSDGNGFWDVHGSAEALKARERQARVVAGLTEAQSDVLSVLEAADAADGWLTTRQVMEGLGEDYDRDGPNAAGKRRVLKRLEVLGLVDIKKVGVENSFRARVNAVEQREVDMTSSHGSHAAAQGISLVHTSVNTGSQSPCEPPAPDVNRCEPRCEPPIPPAAQRVNNVNHLPVQAAHTTGSHGSHAVSSVLREWQADDGRPSARREPRPYLGPEDDFSALFSD